MAEERIVIDIDENGTITAKTDGIKGDMCLKEIDGILDNDQVFFSVKKTDEYYQNINKENRNILRNKTK